MIYGLWMIDWLVVWNMNGLCFHLLGMSSSQPTKSYLMIPSGKLTIFDGYIHYFNGHFQ